LEERKVWAVQSTVLPNRKDDNLKIDVQKVPQKGKLLSAVTERKGEKVR
jgi:hypothetical protein